MKIAVTYENGKVFQHFGHCGSFRIYETEGKEIQSAETISAEGSGHGALAEFLKKRGVEVLICGGIGGGAREALSEAGIRLYPGVSGDANQAVRALLDQTLVFDPDTVCSHHHEGSCGDQEGGSCEGHGSEGCGHHGNGHCGEDKHGCRGNF